MSLEYGFILALGALIFAFILSVFIGGKSGKRQIKRLASDVPEISPQHFFELRDKVRKKTGGDKKFSGVYILHNKTKDIYYVGQGIQVPNRVNAHFTGKGNGDVYADYKYGDKFTIRLIPLYKSGFKSLDELEAAAINAYGAFINGYNKTKGNVK